MIEIQHFLILSSLLFLIGVFGIFKQKKCDYNSYVHRINFISRKY